MIDLRKIYLKRNNQECTYNKGRMGMFPTESYSMIGFSPTNKSIV